MLSKTSWILFLLMMKIFKDDINLLANVTFIYKTLIPMKCSRDPKFVTSLVQSAIHGETAPHGSPNPDPLSDQKNFIFHTCSQTWPLKPIPTFTTGQAWPS